MQQLSGLDGAFLTMESGHVFGHVGSVCILDTRTARHRLTLRHVTRVIESRLPLVPLFRRKLVAVPFGLDQPYWVDDPDFDIEFHVRSLALPSPGSDAQLAEQVAALHARPLDRNRPLWELYLITGLSGRRAAIYSKIHHAAIDGVSGGDVMTAVLDLTPEGRPAPEEQPFEGETRPGAPWLLARSAATLATQPVRAARLATELARSVPGLAVAARPLAERIARRPPPGADVRCGAAGTGHPVQRPHLGPPALGDRRPAPRRGQGGAARHPADGQRRGDGALYRDAAALPRRARRAAAGSAGGGRAGVRAPPGPGRHLRQQDLADADRRCPPSWRTRSSGCG